MGVTTITSYEAFQQAINGDKPVIVDFTATWCGPCKMIGPIFEKISETPASEKLNFFKVSRIHTDKEKWGDDIGREPAGTDLSSSYPSAFTVRRRRTRKGRSRSRNSSYAYIHGLQEWRKD